MILGSANREVSTTLNLNIGSRATIRASDGISVHSLLEGAERATGTVAVIDVFRAVTSAAVALANGASGIVMVRTVEEALMVRDTGVGQISMGEVHGRAPPDFDFGNSPFEISALISSAKRSSSGPALGRRVSSPQVGPNDFTRPRWSRQRRPSAPFSKGSPDRVSLYTLSTRW